MKRSEIEKLVVDTRDAIKKNYEIALLNIVTMKSKLLIDMDCFPECVC